MKKSNKKKQRCPKCDGFLVIPSNRESIQCTNCGWTHYLGLDISAKERAKEVPTSKKKGKGGPFK